ncbi:hypothetical protein [Mycobacterium sp. E3198]|uniref:hypothetical protein n=1 Tax=Mycobacterium sp. E3198 TaxID=1834143 RepID=UPI000801E3A4|nr:hypothetical protein [Mycobacterium sp. E3198]OBG35759.1 hypothetical protein A5673_19645 [Mycobacterium sp. E3198]
MAPNGPPDDFHNQRTQFANYGGPGGPPRPGESPPADIPSDQAGAPEAPDALDPFDQEPEPTPWYRRPLGVIAWVIAVAILLALIVYGLMELIQGGQGTSPSTTSSTTPTTATTTPMTTTPTTTAPSETPGSSAVEPPAQQPTGQPTRQPTQQQPTHRHHLPQLPSVITIPDGPVVTLPPLR